MRPVQVICRATIVALLTAASSVLVGGSPALADDANQRNVAAIAHVNDIRIAMGLEPLVTDPGLQRAALAHAKYLVANDELGHTEVSGKPYYTGSDPFERARAAGFTGPTVGEVATSGGGDEHGVDIWLGTVYHRHVLLDPTVRLAGYGAAHQPTGRLTALDDVVDVGDYSRAGKLAFYPYDGMRDVPWTWSGRETPDPLPGVAKPVGPPISVLRGFRHSLSIASATVTGPMGPVQTTLVSDELWGAASVIPLAPLQQGTIYTASVTGTSDGGAFDQRWSFTTATMPGRPSLDALSLSSGTYLGWSPGSGSAPTSYLLKCNGCPVEIERRVFAANITSAFDAIPAGTHVVYFLTPYVRDVEGQTAFVVINGGGTAPAYHARWYQQSAYPDNLRPGELTSVWIAFMNTGTAAWVRGVWGQQANLGLNLDDTQPYQLHMDANWLWNNRIATTDAAVVAPGEVGEFRFQVRAPMQPGVYSLHVRPVVDGQAWMEDDGVFLNFTVR